MLTRGFLNLVISVLVIQLATGIAIYFGFSDASDAWTKRGQFGDMFGMANALFSGLAFAGLTYTIYLQQHQIDLSKDVADAQLNAATRAVHLSTIDQLIRHYDAKLAPFKFNHQDMVPETRAWVQDLEIRKAKLQTTLDQFYEDVVKGHRS